MIRPPTAGSVQQKLSAVGCMLPSVILITGASSGIGAALAMGYAAEGVTLLLTARNEERLNAVAQSCRARGATVHIEAVDVTDKPRLAEWILRMDVHHPVDLVIANAGISAGTFSGGEALEAAEAVFDVNVTGVINTIHPLLPRMTERKAGQVAIMASLASLRPLPSAPAYSASKAAVRFYGEALRPLLKQHGVFVSVICPGWITTPLTDVNDFPMPFIMSSERAASIIIHRLAQKKSCIAFPYRLYFLLRILALLPLRLTDPLFVRISGNKRKR